MNQFEAVIAAARQAAQNHANATSQAQAERRQAFESEMEPILRAERRRKGKETEDEWDAYEPR